MNEKLLSFIWQFQYFEKSNLMTDDGLTVQVLKTGTMNTDSGPDFSGARIILNNLEWAGDIEIHVNASDWTKHDHQTNHSFESVILQVVWNNDQKIIRKDGTELPTISLNGLVQKKTILRYQDLIGSSQIIPCESQFAEIGDIEKYSMLDRVLMERMQTKSENVLALWMVNKSDWEETAYQLLGQHFGFKLNDVCFLRLCQNIPRKVLLQQHGDLFKIEALLFGGSGLLPENPSDEYTTRLAEEYRYLAQKYQLKEPLNGSEWKFLRLRPAGFPTLRLAQLAQFLADNDKVFNTLTNTNSITELHKIFNLRQSEYWTTHLQFGKTSGKSTPKMGTESSNNLIINVTIPLLFAYAKSLNRLEYQDKALQFLSEIPAENNRITRIWKNLGMKVETSADSQGLIQWYNDYCIPKRCLQCSIGAKLIRSN